MILMKIRLLIAFFIYFIQGYASALESNSRGGFIDFNFYPYLSDVDSDNSITINAASSFENRFSYFSLTNFGNQADANALGDQNTFYTEQNVRWQINENSPFDLTLQMNFRSGDNNDRHRLGVRWRLNNTQSLKAFFESIHLTWAVNFHLVQFDDVPANVWQMEHAFKMTFPSINNKLYLAGFIDHTFNEDLATGMPSSPVVGEVQLGYRMVENLHLVAEYRVNQYRRSDVNNLAIGIEYIMKW